MIEFFRTILYEPLYNGLVFLVGVVPYGDVGLSVIVLTVFVRLVLFPLSHKSTKAQAQMKAIEPEVKKIKEQHKDDRQEQAKKTMELYKKHGVNPFSGILFVIIQLPVIISLYWVFYGGLSNGFSEDALYSFVKIPESFNSNFLGFIDLFGKSVILAALAGGTQYFQLKLSMPKVETKPSQDSKPSFKD